MRATRPRRPFGPSPAGDCWRILDTSFDHGLDFLAAWHAWKQHREKPRILHFVAIADDACPRHELIAAASAHPHLLPLAYELADQWIGLTPDAHRLAFDGGRVLLTLHVREAAEVLRGEPFTVDEVLLGEASSAQAVKAVARHCRRGTHLTIKTGSGAGDLQQALAECGFAIDRIDAGVPAQAVFDPAWEPRGMSMSRHVEPQDAVVIGGGLAGAAAAASLARRGWRVTVIDAADEPAAGASALPVGLLAPHHSPDDNILSRASRSGVRMTMREARLLLREGWDWSPCGTLEHRIGEPDVPSSASDAYLAWSAPAPEQKKAAALLDTAACALWHEQAGWIKPTALVRAWLAAPGITWRGGLPVNSIAKLGDRWAALDTGGNVVASASLVVVASALASAELLGGRVPLNPVRGQISWAAEAAGFEAPTFPVNGNGHFIPRVPHAGGRAWFSGSTYGRGDTDASVRRSDQRANESRLQSLLPKVAAQLGGAFEAGDVNAWSGVRCTSSDRRPLVGEVEPGLWVSTAMGSRGLTFCALSAELIAARLHGEPLPVEHKLARSLDVARSLSQPRSSP